jgi:hypothetical protein
LSLSSLSSSSSSWSSSSSSSSSSLASSPSSLSFEPVRRRYVSRVAAAAADATTMIQSHIALPGK